MKISIENVEIKGDSELITIGIDENTKKLANKFFAFVAAIPKVKKTLEKLNYETPQIGETLTIKTNLLCQLKKQKVKSE